MRPQKIINNTPKIYNFHLENVFMNKHTAIYTNFSRNKIYFIYRKVFCYT